MKEQPGVTDKVLGKHYGLNEEELDFITNYDIKYRMGKNCRRDGIATFKSRAAVGNMNVAERC